MIDMPVSCLPMTHEKDEVMHGSFLIQLTRHKVSDESLHSMADWYSSPGKFIRRYLLATTLKRIERASIDTSQLLQLASILNTKLAQSTENEVRLLDAVQTALISGLNGRRSSLASSTIWSDLRLPMVM